ncbi:SNF2 [Gracilaria domingensis]|nr:SNF2 [Gracilaria domingensis]
MIVDPLGVFASAKAASDGNAPTELSDRSVPSLKTEKESNSGRSETVSTLHGVLRPSFLYRLKADLEKGLPPKTEHVISCRLSKRQQQLYEEFMVRNDIQESLQSGDLFLVMNTQIVLGNVFNQPHLFEGRPIFSPFSCAAILIQFLLMWLESREKTESNCTGRCYVDEIARISALKQMRGDLKDEASAESLGSNLDFVPSDPAKQDALSRKAAFRRAASHHHVLIDASRIRQRSLLQEDLRICSR